MDRLIAYGVLGFALYKLFWSDKSKQNIEQPKVEDKVQEEKKMNMIGFAYHEGKKVEGVNGLYFEGNMNFFD